MISTKKLLQLAKKWQKLAAASRKRLSWPRPVAPKGYFVVYSADGKRFMIPLAYLNSEILKELLYMAEEEYGVSSDCPITLPFDSSFLEYALSVLKKHANQDVERALLRSLGSCRSSSSSCLQQDQGNQQLQIQIC